MAGLCLEPRTHDIKLCYLLPLTAGIGFALLIQASTKTSMDDPRHPQLLPVSASSCCIVASSHRRHLHDLQSQRRRGPPPSLPRHNVNRNQALSYPDASDAPAAIPQFLMSSICKSLSCSLAREHSSESGLRAVNQTRRYHLAHPG